MRNLQRVFIFEITENPAEKYDLHNLSSGSISVAAKNRTSINF